jgi:hypothetical protein
MRKESAEKILVDDKEHLVTFAARRMSVLPETWILQNGNRFYEVARPARRTGRTNLRKFVQCHHKFSFVLCFYLGSFWYILLAMETMQSN